MYLNLNSKNNIASMDGFLLQQDLVFLFRENLLKISLVTKVGLFKSLYADLL